MDRTNVTLEGASTTLSTFILIGNGPDFFLAPAVFLHPTTSVTYTYKVHSFVFGSQLLAPDLLLT